MALHHREPSAHELDQLTRRASEGIPTLVVVDDVDGAPADDAEVQQRWQRLHRLTVAGATVVAGSSGAAPRFARVLDLADSTHTSQRTPEEATV